MNGWISVLSVYTRHVARPDTQISEAITGLDNQQPWALTDKAAVYKLLPPFDLSEHLVLGEAFHLTECEGSVE